MRDAMRIRCILHRSWTGQPVYKLTLKNLPNGAELTETLWSKELTGIPDFDSDYQVRLLDFLISNLLLGQSKPFPVPSGLEVKSAEKANRPWWRIW
jgi:hypothetical protein